MDAALKTIAEYVVKTSAFSKEAEESARIALLDALGCAMLALQFPACRKLLGPLIPGTFVPEGTHLLGTDFILDPVTAAFQLGSMIRWLDYNDTFLGKEWGHPSDNIGALYALLDHLPGKSVNELLHAMIKAYEIQGVLALENSYNSLGFDHVALVKIASSAVTAHLLGGDIEEVASATSQAILDVGPLRTYRHAPSVGPRKSWAAGDATSRGLLFAYLTMRGEPGYPEALSSPTWGFNARLFPFTLNRPLQSFVIENILFKVSYPAEFHAQTAVECAIKLHPKIKNREIRKIKIVLQEPAMRIINKTGPLKNPADRDHCLQYMVAVALLKGNLTALDYEEEDPRVDLLREKMQLFEEPRFTKEYYEMEKRSIAAAVSIETDEGIHSETVEYPIGHPRRRREALPLLLKKAKENLLTRFSEKRVEEILNAFQNVAALQMKDLTQLFLDDKS